MRLGKATALAAIVIGIVLSMVAFGYFYPYWRKVDQDVVLAYQGLLFNDGAPQSYFDHTGYFYYLLIGGWYGLLHVIGLLPIASLSAMPAASDPVAFDAAWTNLIRAGRVLSALFAGFFVLSFAAGVRALLRDGRIAMLAAFALATSGSLMMHARIMRTEMLAAFFTTAVLVMSLLAARELRRSHQVALLAAVGLCAVLAIETKVQALIPLMAIPPLAIFFGARRTDETAGGWFLTAVLALAAAIAAPLAANVILRGFALNSGAYAPLGPLPDGLYQAVVLLWPVACIIAFAIAWRRGFAEPMRAVLALTIGASLGVLALMLRFNPQNVAALTHPVEHMLLFASGAPGAPGVAPRNLFDAIGGGVLSGISAHTFFLSPTARPTLLAEWFAIGAAIVAWRRGERIAPLQAAMLIGAAWAIDSVFSLRGIKDAYLVFTDPFLLLAAGVMLTRFPELFDSRAARRWVIGLAALSVLWAHVEPIKLAFSKRGPELSCEWLPHYVPNVRFPFCPS